MTADMCTPNPGGAVNPEAWPIPKVSPSALEGLASRLRSHGSELAGVGQDIKSQWAGLSSCYAAPESETLFAVLDPVATDGDEVEESMDDAASALEDFAERARDIKGRWNTLKTEAEAFLATIDTSTDEWRQAEGWWDRLWGKESGNVGRNNELHAEAVALQQEYEEAERNCANAINAGITGRTNFVAGDLSGEQELDGNDYVHGYEGDLSDVPMAWGAPVETDHGWWVDAGHAVWDYGVGAVEGLGGMVGAYSSEGWFEASWGDAMWEHWEGTVQSAASLVGMYDAEGDSWGWSGWDSVGSAWKDAAHAVVPWEEWGERPGYVIGTALLNIGATVGGAVLTATGVGAVVGVPLMAWRGAAMLDKMGGSRVPDVSLDGIDLSRGLPAYGNPGMPRISVDLSGLNPLRNVDLGRMPDLRGTIDRLLRLNAHDGQGQVPDTGDRSRAGDSDDATRDPTVEQVSESERLLEELGLDPSLSRTFDGMDATAGDYPAWEMSQTPGSPSDAPPPKVPVGAVARADAMEHDGGTGRNQFNLTGTGDDLPDGLDGDRVPDADASHGSPVVTNSAGDGGTGNGYGNTASRDGVTEGDRTTVREDRSPSGGHRPDGAPGEPSDRGPGGPSDRDPGNPTDGDAPEHAEDPKAPGQDSATDGTPDDAVTETGESPEERPGPADTAERDLPSPQETPFGDPRPTPTDLSRGSILERVAEDRVTRGDDGLIDTIDGKPLDTYLHDLVTQRAEDMVRITKEKIRIPVDRSTLENPMHSPKPGESMIKDIQLSKGDLGGKRGSVNSIVIDRVTGTVAEGVNGRSGTVSIRPNSLHPEMLDRLEQMRNNGPYQHVDKDGNPTGMEEFPHGDNPLRHAEVKAINELLLERPDARVSEFQLDNQFTFKTNDAAKAPCCANCTRMTRDAPAPRVGKYSRLPWDPNNTHTFEDN
ncbi:YwqJ-related putative deaminase [Nocardiopsis lucentensis]|uniref:YwqJ-related putative deaminase n=1 Tax=Nocardiopsis lucentensis TaxID=53441 RepID=UPI0003480BE5|nr:YwqJ-related putative deaminase [Nocardiopsis lucentensis]